MDDDVHRVVVRIEYAHGATLRLGKRHHMAQKTAAQFIDCMLAGQQCGDVVQCGQLALLRG